MHSVLLKSQQKQFQLRDQISLFSLFLVIGFSFCFLLDRFLLVGFFACLAFCSYSMVLTALGLGLGWVSPF